jgi:hypothetical protein
MTAINPPQSGQPIDYAYISAIVTEVNSLRTDITAVKELAYIKNLTVKQPMISANVVAFAETLEANATSKQITISFQKQFGDVPVVTATFEPAGTSKKNGMVVITDITTSGAKAYIISQTKGDYSGNIHFVAVGRAG